MEEELEQKMTFVLAEIDSQFVKAHEAATHLLRSVRRHSQTTRQMHSHCRLFHELFVQLHDQAAPALRPIGVRPSPQHVRDAHHRGMSLDTSILSHGTGMMDPDDHYDSFLQDDFDDLQLKTTTLAAQKRTTTPSHTHSINDSNLSMDVSSPAMLRTPFLRKPAASALPTPAASTSGSMNTSMDAFPTPEIPFLTNRVQLHAPMEHVAEEVVGGSFISELPSEAATPDFPTLTRPLSSPILPPPSSPSVREGTPMSSPSMSDLDASMIDPTSPAAAATASSMATPQWQATPAASSVTTDLRRRFSAAADYHTPRKASKPPTGAADDDLEFDNVDSPLLASPLLSTKLKVMTPHTPLSNRIAGASTQTPYRSPYAALSPSTPQIPIFDLLNFPPAFQKGESAYLMTRLYSLFRNNPTQAMTVAELVTKLDECESERVEILLDTLVSRGLLRPFAVAGQMYWQAAFK
ncbi:Aste57867_3398 [Aphanomyces stellatus]|uniref:Aste57867_3398 protein n=1 Tax=Aphanomyces stellatus TaxID=120398 RepID=A0A485KF27_9STRA|nr:hypothetical protein As57867_003388 [Aphanomyces stellatus]VFT80564.1 Aste57867_3398 [Aphanomyces stellatus]